MSDSRQSGRTLLTVLLLGLAVSSSAATLATAVARTSRELRAQRDVLCARYGARAGLAAGMLLDDRPELVSAELESLRIRILPAPGSACLLRAEAVCGRARRSAQVRVAPALCDSGGLRFRTPP